MKNIIFTSFFSIILFTSFQINAQTRVAKKFTLNPIHTIQLNENEIFYPHSLSLDEEGLLIFYDSGSEQILSASLIEDDFKFNRVQLKEGRGPGETKGIWGLGTDSKGGILLSDSDRMKYLEFTIDGTFIRELSSGSKFNVPTRIAVCNNHDWFYSLSTQYGPDGFLHRIDRKGNLLNSFEKISDKNEYQPFYFDGRISCDNDGNLYYATRYKNIIKKFSPEGKVIHNVEVYGFRPNEEIMVRDGRFFSLHKSVRKSSGDIMELNNEYFVVGYSNRRDKKIFCIDFYKQSEGSYEYSLVLPELAEEFVMNDKYLVTIYEDELDELYLKVYQYSLEK